MVLSFSETFDSLIAMFVAARKKAVDEDRIPTITIDGNTIHSDKPYTKIVLKGNDLHFYRGCNVEFIVKE